ncbi:UV excision repair protein RAD23 homolog A [Ceratitis capitata]|uniref:UV excision repair protein RAD23 homolog A n=1 Tax=Ceratitis capitata TaxID=7213 RepID=UPI000329C52D|nr:UV excision repair protein RAD23 homolog A [Ceratitis capitata]
MKLSIKTLDQRNFSIDSYGLKTVLHLKRKLFNVGVTNLLPERQQLMYAGRVLNDSKLLSFYSIDERKFLLVMAKKAWRTPIAEEPTVQANNNTNNKSKATQQIKPPNAGQGDEVDMNGKQQAKTKQRTRSGNPLKAKKSTRFKACKPMTNKGSAVKIARQITASPKITSAPAVGDCKEHRASVSSIESADSQQRRRQELKKERRSIIKYKPVKSKASLLSTAKLYATKKASNMRTIRRRKTKKPPQVQVCDKFVLRQIVAMGYNEDDVRRALIASFNNPNEAVDYLVKQVQERMAQQPKGKSNQKKTQNNKQKNCKLVAGASSNERNSLAFLRNDPDFRNLRRLLRRRPNILQDVIKRVDTSHPELLQMLKEHESEFLQLLHENAENSADDEEQCENCNFNSMQISPEEEKVIARLVQMGFKRQMVVLAFIACDRDVEKTVDYLCRIDDIHI